EAGRRRPAGEPRRALVDDRAQVGKRGAQRVGAGGAQPVWPPPTGSLDGFDQAALLQPADRAVQRAGPESHTCELLNVLQQRVAVFLALGEAGQDEERWVVRAPGRSFVTSASGVHGQNDITSCVITQDVILDRRVGARAICRSSSRDAPSHWGSRVMSEV